MATITSGRDITLIGVGLSAKPVWITFSGEQAMLNADLFDADDELVLQSRDNEVRINKDNAYEVRTLPDR